MIYDSFSQFQRCVCLRLKSEAMSQNIEANLQMSDIQRYRQTKNMDIDEKQMSNLCFSFTGSKNNQHQSRLNSSFKCGFGKIYLIKIKTMMTSKAIIFCILIALAMTKQIKIGCKTHSNCTSGYAWTYTDPDEVEYEQCSDEVCENAFGVTLDVIKCKADYEGKTCSTGICYYFSSFQQCQDRNNTCTDEYSFYMECGGCASSSCKTGLCYKYQGYQACTDEDISECEFSKMNMYQQNCPNEVDSHGGKCSCCEKMSFTDSALGMCAEDMEYDSETLQSFASDAHQTFIHGFRMLLIAAMMLLVLGLK